MAEDERGEQQGGGKKKGGLLKIIMIVVLILVILLGLLFAGWYFFMRDTGVQQQQGQGGGAQQEQQSSRVGPLYPFETFIVNLSDPGGTRYLKVTMQAELSSDSGKLMEEMDRSRPKLRDRIIEVLSSKTYDEVSTPQGKLALKQEIIRQLNLVLSNGSITNVYITEFVVQ